MSSLTLLIALPAVGFMVGFLVSLVGGSGGVFYVPLLILGFGVDPRVAVTTSLATMIPTAIIGSWSHHEQKNLDLGTGMIFGLSGMCSAFAGVFISNRISAGNLETLMGIALVALSVPMAGETIRRIRPPDEPVKRPTIPENYRLPVSITFGALSGFMSGLLGLSGLSFVATGMYLLGYSAATVIGTSVFVLLFNTMAGLAGYLWYGQFDIGLILLLSATASAGAFMAPMILSRIDRSLLEKIYGPAIVAVLVVFGLAMIMQV